MYDTYTFVKISGLRRRIGTIMDDPRGRCERQGTYPYQTAAREDEK